MTVLDEPFTPLEESLERLQRAVSPLVGIVKPLCGTMHMPDESPLPNFGCEIVSSRRTLGQASVEVGSGAHPDPRRARAAAIGEALERYSAMYVPDRAIAVSSARELGPVAVPPARFALFHTRQHELPGFRFAPFTETTSTQFVQGISLEDGSPAMLPAQLVYLRPPPQATPAIGYSTSSGLACGATVGEAVLSALLELVERDAVMLTWKCRLSLPLLDWSDDAEVDLLDHRFFRRTGIGYAVLDASAFLGLPVAIGVVHGPVGSRTALSVGAGCAASMRDAWLKALSEGFGVYRWLRQRVLSDPHSNPPNPASITTFEEHMLFYAREEEAAHAAFLDASHARRRLDEAPALDDATPRGQIETVVRKLADRGVSAYAVDLTSPDVASIGVRVMRVVAPELCALDVPHAARFLGGTRLYRAAHEAGLSPAPVEFDDLNPHPHPFP